MRRYTCPKKKHPGANAPERMHAEDIRRFCLPCSTESGRLVRRECPALNRRRAEKSRRRQAKAKRAKESGRRGKERRQARRLAAVKDHEFVVIGDHTSMNIRDEFSRLLALPFMRGRMADLNRPDPELRLRRRQASHTSGVCYCGMAAIAVTIPRIATPGHVGMILAHELAHYACPDAEWHGELWRSTYARLLLDAYGCTFVWPTREGTKRRVAVWYADEAVRKLLDQQEERAK